jgi:hypothetical protein
MWDGSTGVSWRAMPKSITTACPLSSRMFSGLMSRWHDALRVRAPQRAGDLLGKAERVVERQPTLALQPAPQRLATREGHDEVRPQVVGAEQDLAGVEERQDVRMVQPRDHADLAREALGRVPATREDSAA